MTTDVHLHEPSMSNPLLKGHIVKFVYDVSFFGLLSHRVSIPSECDFVPRSLLVCRDFEHSPDDHRYTLALSDQDDLQEILFYSGSVGCGYSPKPSRLYCGESLPRLSFHSILLALGRIDIEGEHLRSYEECLFVTDLWSSGTGLAMFRHSYHFRVFYGVRVLFNYKYHPRRSPIFNHMYYPRRFSTTEQSEYFSPVSSTNDVWSYGFPGNRWFCGDDLPLGPMIPPWMSYVSPNPGSPMEHALNFLKGSITEDRLAGRDSPIYLLQELYSRYPENNAFVQALHYLLYHP